jgi:hypothetical protein
VPWFGGQLIVLTVGIALLSQGAALAAPMPTAGLCNRSVSASATPLQTRLVGSLSTRVDLARGEWCRADCPQFAALPPTKDEVLLSESVESLPKGGILLTRLSANASQRVFLVYQSWTEFRWPVREVLTLIHCGPEAHQ